MRIAICDDCTDDIDALKSVLTDYAEKNHKMWQIDTYCDGRGFLDNSMDTDLVLLDIEMSEINGIETGRQAKSINPELRIIMFTGAEGYGEEIFDIGAIDYISKPLNSERVINSVLKVESLMIGNDYIAANRNWISCNVRQKDIQYIKAYNGYVFLICGSRRYRVDKSLKDIEKELDQRIFLRIHKSVIVNMLHVKYLSKTGFCIGDIELEISRRRHGEVEKAWIEFDLKYNIGRRMC